MRTLTRATLWATFRVLAASTVLYGSLALGAFVWFQTPAYPQDVAAKGDLALPEKDDSRVVRCGMDFSTLVGLPGWRILEGDKLQAYLETAFTPVPDGDAMAYFKRGDKVALVLGRDGCVVGRRAIPAKMHKRVIEAALGVIA